MFLDLRSVVALAGLLLAVPASAFDLQITEMWPGNEPGSNLTDDWFEITNQGATAWIGGTDPDLFYDDESADPGAADPITGITEIQPGEAVVVLVTDEAAAADAFAAVWATAYVLDGVQIGVTDGAGLGQGGDGVALFVGTPDPATLVDFEEFPDADAFGGQSWDVAKGGFSEAGDAPFDTASTLTVNDAGQPGVGSPGNLGSVSVVGEIPVIELNGEGAITVERGTEFIDPGFVATDTEDGDISSDVVVGGDTVDADTFGVYQISYDVMDSDGNASATAARTVTVTFAESIPRAPIARAPNFFKQVATLGDLPGAEIPAYDVRSKQGYVTSGDGLQIVDLSDPKNPALGALLDPVANYGLGSSAITSVDTCRGIVAFAVPSDPETDPGAVVFTKPDGTLIRIVTVGALPDMVTFTQNCKTLLVANEGQPDGDVDPEGSISLIRVSTGHVRTADFQRFNGQEDALRNKGVRIFPGVSAANDFEPEYIAVSENGREAWVTLQEANAVAVVNIRGAKVSSIVPLGLKDHSRKRNALDASDRDGVINIQPWPLKGMYMPDAIASYGAGWGWWSSQYYITANEGDARDADERVEDLTLDPTAFPPELDLQNEFNLGRIQVSNIDGDIDGDGDFDELQSYGARSFSIWNRWGKRVYDSGDDIEAIVATETPDAYVDGRSDNKGPEPEGVEVGRFFGFNLAFIGLERTSQVLVYDVSRPWAPRYLQLLQNEGDEAPEGLKFLPWYESPNFCPSLLVTNEGSNTLTVYQASFCVR